MKEKRDKKVDTEEGVNSMRDVTDTGNTQTDMKRYQKKQTRGSTQR